MTPSRLLKILGATTALLLLLWLGYLYTQVPHRKAPYAKAATRLDLIHLQRGAARVDLKWAGLHRFGGLEQEKSETAWTLAAPDGRSYRADPEKIKSLLEALKDLQLDQEISDRPDRAADFEITADSGLRVALQSGGRTIADGIFGKQAPDFSHIYFKFPDSPIVYLAGGVILGELGGVDLNDWRDHGLVAFGDTQIDGIVIENAGDKIDLERSSSTWSMNGRPIDPSPVYGLVGSLAHLKADDFVNPASTPTVAFEQLKSATITVKAAGQTRVLRLGKEDKPSRRFPVAVDPQSLVWLSEYKVQSLLPKPSVFQPKK